VSHLRFKLKKQISRTSLYNGFIMLFLFLATMNFGNYGYYWLIVAFIVFLFTPNRLVRINLSSIYLFILAVSMLIFDPLSRTSITSCIKPFMFLIAYTVGISLAAKTNDNPTNERTPKHIIYVCAFGMLSHFLLNLLRLIKNFGSLERNTTDIWTNAVLSATGQASLACLSIAIFASFLFTETTVKKKVFSLFGILVILLYNLILAGRTLIVLIAVVCLIAFLFRAHYDGRHIEKSVLGIAVMTVALLIVYNFNIFNIKSIVENSNLYARLLGFDGLGLFGDSRFGMKLLYLQKFLEHPFGGAYIRSICGNYAHDLYLDCYDQYSIFALFAIIAYILSSLIRLFRCLRNASLSFPTKQLVLCTYIVANLEFLIEPIIQGMPFLLISYCIIDGTISYYLTIKTKTS